jgi:ubiquitin
MLITIRTLQGKEIPLEVQSTDTIQNVKKKIQDKEGIRTDLQRLTLANTSLENGRTLASYNIGANTILGLMERKYFRWIVFIKIMLEN